MKRYYQPEIECASVEQIKAWQNEKIVKQVKHVYENVPYYRNLMDEKGVKPGLFEAQVSGGMGGMGGNPSGDAAWLQQKYKGNPFFQG